MPLIYALVARGTTILSDYAVTSGGNFTWITAALLERIPSPSAAGGDVAGASSSSSSAAAAAAPDTRATYVYDQYLFHYLQKNGITYLCLADDQFGRRVPFAFLDDIARRFESLYGTRAHTAIAYGLNEFSRIIADQMNDYSSGKGDKFKDLSTDLSHVKSIMVSNIEKVLDRGDRINHLVDKTESLSQAGFAFKRRATALRRQMWWKNTRLMAVMGVGGVLTVYFVVAMQCGVPAWHNCVGRSG